MEQLSELFKALSEPLRLRIVHRLLANGKDAYYGEELAKALGVPAYRLSRHLKVLKSTGLVTERKEGRWVYYSLTTTNRPLVETLRRLLAEAKAPSHGDRGRNGRNGQQPFFPSRRRHLLSKTKLFSWDQGPAVPGVL